MKRLAVLVTVAISLAFAAVQASAAAPAANQTSTKKSSEPATQPKLVKVSPPASPATGSANKSQTFQVNDVKGLLMTCVAPEIDTDPDTDAFQSCALAPGRTLDDVMHTFIQALHMVQNKQMKERAEWDKEREEMLLQKSVQK